MTRDGLRGRVLDGEVTFGMFLNLGSPLAAELAAGAGFDWAIVDLEHGGGTEADLLGLLQAVGSAGATAVVRVEEATRLRIGRALDLGAPAVMLPRVDGLEQARAAVSWLRYPPSGRRGVALPTRGAGFGRLGHADVATHHESVLGVFQVESVEAVETAGSIAALDGVDVLFVGPSDLSHALGVPGDITDDRYIAAIARIGEAAAAHGKAAGILLWSADDLARHLELGYRFIALGSDGGYVAQGSRAAVAALRSASAALD